MVAKTLAPFIMNVTTIAMVVLLMNNNLTSGYTTEPSDLTTTSWDDFDNFTTMDNATNVTTAAPGPGFVQRLKATTEYIVARSIQNKKYWILVPLALLGNGLTVSVMAKRMKTSSSCFYIGMVAIWDTVALISKGIQLYTNIYGFYLSAWGCRVLIFMASFAINYAVWLVVAMTFERMIAVTFPFKAATMCTVRRAILVSCGLAVFFIGQNIVTFWVIDIGHAVIYGWYCTYNPFSEEFSKAWTWFDSCIYSIFPLSILFILNIMIIINLSIARKRQKSLQGSGQNKSKSSTVNSETKPKAKKKQGKSLTMMLLSVSIIFMVLTTPYCVFVIYTPYWDYQKSVDSYSLWLILQSVVYLMNDINNCCNFFLYFMSAARFRKDLFKLIRKIFCCCKKSKSPPSISRSTTNGSTVTTTSEISSSTQL